MVNAELGDTKLKRLEGGVNPGMEGHQVLSGMSFLKELDFRQSDNKLVLIQRSP